ncbi:hypothetical protein ACX6XY_22340 [Streptomyces sp. O3]
MHRSTTTAALLVTVTASAVSGCVTVDRPPGAEPPSPTATPPAAPEARHGTEPREVQAPAREALEMISPADNRASPSAPPSGPVSPRPAAAPAESAGPGHTARPETVPPVRTPGGDARPPLPSRLPRIPVPTTAPPGLDPGGVTVPEPEVERAWAGLCGLGERYGGWAPDSPEARICQEAYGR